MIPFDCIFLQATITQPANGRLKDARRRSLDESEAELSCYCDYIGRVDGKYVAVFRVFDPRVDRHVFVQIGVTASLTNAVKQKATSIQATPKKQKVEKWRHSLNSM